jgi:hypothetical protein
MTACKQKHVTVTGIRAVTGLPMVSGMVLVLCLAAANPLHAAGFWNGLQIMQEVHRRHQLFPYVYEEHSIVLQDYMGQRDTRQARLYTRVEDNGELKIIYIFQAPNEVIGVTLMAVRKPDGKTDTSIYLPAFGDQFIESSWTGSGGNFLGTDFSVEDLTAETLSNYRYVRRDDKKISDMDYFVIDVYPVDGQKPADGHPLKRHFVRQDNFFTIRTDYFDMQGHLYKQMHKYDLKQLDTEMWGAGLILMDDIKMKHQSIIKVDRRVFSIDYVPEEMFSKDWILATYPPLQQQQTAANGAPGPDREIGASELSPTDTSGREHP